jgi:hypothetical protein
MTEAEYLKMQKLRLIQRGKDAHEQYDPALPERYVGPETHEHTVGGITGITSPGTICDTCGLAYENDVHDKRLIEPLGATELAHSLLELGMAPEDVDEHVAEQSELTGRYRNIAPRDSEEEDWQPMPDDLTRNALRNVGEPGDPARPRPRSGARAQVRCWHSNPKIRTKPCRRCDLLELREPQWTSGKRISVTKRRRAQVIDINTGRVIGRVTFADTSGRYQLAS